MAKRSKAYFGLGWIVSIILAIFPVTNWLFGFITRFQRGHYIAGILQLFGIGEIIFYFTDLISMIVYKDIKFFA